MPNFDEWVGFSAHDVSRKSAPHRVMPEISRLSLVLEGDINVFPEGRNRTG
jgi:hypothetical protein